MKSIKLINMKLSLYIFCCCCLILAACGSRNGNSHSDGNNHNAKDWFQEGAWRQGWEVNADETLDIVEFSSRYSANPGRWQRAFEFLATTNLANMKPGRYELDGEQLFAIVLAVAKDEADTRFEAHKKYADIQYVIAGRERIGVVPLESARMVEPYDDAKDIAFFETNENNYRPASAKNFFVFFPDEAHRPGVRVSEDEQVKKIVIKVKL